MSTRPRPASDHFWDKVRRTDTCWLWLAARDRNGYGRFRVGNRRIAAHSFAWQQVNGPVPDGQELDHLCRHRACVRPDHLELVTRKENVLRGHSFAALNAGKAHCPLGHPYDVENTRRRQGRRECRQCARTRGRLRVRAWRARRKAAT